MSKVDLKQRVRVLMDERLAESLGRQKAVKEAQRWRRSADKLLATLNRADKFLEQYLLSVHGSDEHVREARRVRKYVLVAVSQYERARYGDTD